MFPETTLKKYLSILFQKIIKKQWEIKLKLGNKSHDRDVVWILLKMIFQ